MGRDGACGNTERQHQQSLDVSARAREAQVSAAVAYLGSGGGAGGSAAAVSCMRRAEPRIGAIEWTMVVEKARGAAFVIDSIFVGCS